MVNAHVSLNKRPGTFRLKLSGSAAMSFLFFDQQTPNYHEVIRKHGGSNQELETLVTFGEAAFHTAAAEENRDAPLYARAEALSILESRAFVIGLLSRLFLVSPLRNAYELDSGVFALPDVVRAEKSALQDSNLGD